MHAKQTKRYEMLLRVRDFGNSHGDAFQRSGMAKQAFAAIGSAIDELVAADVQKLSSGHAARADRTIAARSALTDLLLNVSRMARVLRATGRTMPAFEMPESRRDQTMLTTARQFAADAAAFDAEFTGHGVGPPQITARAAALETALRERGMGRADHTAARVRIQAVLRAAVLDVRRLDLIVDSECAGDPVIRSVWKQTRRVETTRGPHGESADRPSAANAPAPAASSDPATFNSTTMDRPSRSRRRRRHDARREATRQTASGPDVSSGPTLTPLDRGP
jgi:hypothetical protein